MVKSESELKKKTKLQLMQWLTKHGQRLPANERLKPYYLEQAIKHFRSIQNGKSQSQSQRKKKYGKNAVVSNTRTKKKDSNTSTSLTPKSRHKNAPLVRTQRRHSSIASPSPSLNRSKKRTIKIARKTPTKKSPSLTRAIKKKRERVRRATADPANLQKEIEKNLKQNNQIESDDDDDDVELDENSENSGDYYNNSHIQQPEKMTIRNLQQWLDDNHIDFVTGQRKAVYVNLVKKHSTKSKKRNLSPKHKKHNSPDFKKPKSYHNDISSPVVNRNRNRKRSAPLPANIRQSPLTPQDDEKTRSRLQKEGNAKANGGMLLTPSLNKTGLARIDTPSKLQMRDEIRNLLQLDDDDGPSYPVQNGVTPGGDGDGITPGGPNEYDANELENVLSDLRRENQPKQVDKQRVKVYDPDSKEHKEKSDSFLSSIMAKFSPHKATSPKSIKSQVNDVLTTNKQKRKASYIAKRTVPSPASPQVFNENIDMNNGNFSSKNPLRSPINDYQQKLELNRYEDDEPMSPAINRTTNNAARKSKRLAEKRKKESPLKAINSYSNQADEAYSNANRQYIENRKQPESPLVPPSIPKQIPRENVSPRESGAKPLDAQPPKGRYKAVIKILFLAVFGAVIGCLFAVFDGVSVTNDIWQNLNEFLAEFSGEKEVLFCESGKKSIGGTSVDCVNCPMHALVCMNGRAQCKTNYILQDNKCVLNGVVVKYAYELNKQIAKILSERKGRYECGEMEVLASNDGYTMNEDELISMCEIFDASKKHEAFEYFQKNILPESTVISVNAKAQYFSYKSIKSASCRVKEWAFTNMLGLITTFLLAVLIFVIWKNYKNKQWEKQEIDNMITDIYNILEEFDKFNKQSHVPIDVIKQRIKPKTNKLWDKVDVLIQKDANISKSIRMIDGLQKRCLALSSVANASPVFPPHSKRNMW